MPRISTPTSKSSKTKRSDKVSPILRWLRWSFRVQSWLSTTWASKRLYELWFRSLKYPEPRREANWRKLARQRSIAHDDGPLAMYHWGESGETILLLHGWNGRGPQLGAFVEPLLNAGYQVVAFDAPGHGRTPGHSSSIFRMNDALQAVLKETGPIKAVIAHSFGVMLLAYALKHSDFKIEKAVCISSPTTPIFLVDIFCAALQIDDKVKQCFMRMVESNYSAEVWQQLAADENVRELTVPALVIHDRDDHDVPVELGERLAAAWPNATLHLTTGLGHRRILRNKAVIQAITTFINR